MNKGFTCILIACCLNYFSAVNAQLAPGIYCVGPSSSYTPPSGPPYINGGAPYPTLTAALTDIQTNGATGAVIFELQNNYISTSESNPISITYQGNAVNTLTIRPRIDLTGQLIIGRPRTNANQIGVLDFNGADYVTVDGTIGNGPCDVYGIMVRNTGFLGNVISFENDATHNTLKGLQIEIGYGNGVFIEYLSGSTGNDYLTFNCCKFKPRVDLENANSSFWGIITRAHSFSVSQNDNIVIENNYFEDCHTAIDANGPGNMGYWKISSNHFYKKHAAPSFNNFMRVACNDTATIRIEGNYFGGSAPFCGGASMVINGLSSITLDCSPSSVNNMIFSNNTLQNISSTNFGDWNILQTTRNAIDIIGNTFGNPNVTNDLSSTQALGFTAISSSTSTSGRTTNILNNSINNVYFPAQNSTFGTFSGISYSATGNHNLNIKNNTLKNISSGSGSAFTLIASYTQFGYGSSEVISGNVAEGINQLNPLCNNLYGITAQGDNVIMTNNRIGSLTNPYDVVYAGKTLSGTGGLIGIISTGNTRLDSNTVSNLNFTNTGDYTRKLIYFGHSASLASCSGNKVLNVSSSGIRNSSETDNYSSLLLVGIFGSGITEYKQNTVNGLYLTTTANASTGVAGMVLQTTGSKAIKNSIYNLGNTATSTGIYPFIIGIAHDGNVITSQNNFISLSNGNNTNGVRIFGLRTVQYYSSQTIYHNTVAISGTGSNAANSYALYRHSSGANMDNIKNNILWNTRTGGSGKHYALANIGAKITSDYNDLYSANTTTLAESPLGTDRTFSTWKSSSSQDANSKNIDAKFINLLSDLHLVINTNCGLDNAGISGTGVSDDFDNETRSTTTPDIGADEFTYNPNWAIASSNSIVCSPPQDVSLSVTDNTYGAFTYNWTGPNGFVSVNASPFINSPTAAASGIYTVTVTDVLGCNSTPASTLVTIHEPPTITCPSNLETNADAGMCAAIVNYDAVEFTGTPTPVVSYSQNSGTSFAIGTTIVDVTASNDCGMESCSFSITVMDNELPVISNCPDDFNVNTMAGECSAIASWILPAATDNCEILSFTSDHNSGDVFLVGTTPVTYSATDIHSNVKTCSFNVVVIDTELPVISSCPSTINLNSDVGNCTAIATWTPPTANDNCSILSFTSNHNSGDAFPVGTTPVTYTATDIHSNVKTCSFNVVVTDIEPPVISNCPSTISLNNDAGNCSAMATWTSPTANDNCGILSFTSNHNIGESFLVGTTSVTYTATDIHSNVKTCTFDVIVTDIELPLISNCPSQININNETGHCSATASWNEPTATDNCGVLFLSGNHNSGDVFPVGNTLVTYTVTDIHNNINTCSFEITISDIEIPVISNCPEAINLNTDVGQCSAIATWTPPTAADNCDILTFTDNHNSGETFPVGSTTVTYTATDIHSNVVTCGFDVNITENENPQITCPVNMVVTGDPNECNAVVNYTATVTDNCPGTTISYSPASGSTLNAGVTTVTATATDASGNHDVCTFDVFVSFPFTFDYNIETLEECSEVTITWHGGCPDWNVNIVLGNLDLYIVQEYVAVNVPNSGSITWTLPPDVPAGNYLFYIEEVSRTTNYLYGPAFIINNTPPNVITQDITVSLDATGNATITADQIDNGSNDICGIDHMTVTPNTFNCSNVGENEVTLSVTDLNGNTVSQTAIVTVIDDQELIVHDCPENIMVSNDAGLCSAMVNWTAPTASDNCEIQSFTSNHESGDVFQVGTSSIVYTAIGFNDEIQTCIFEIVVTDHELPVISNCPETINVNNDVGNCSATVSWNEPTATDNCGVLSFSGSHHSGEEYPVGTTLVIYTATDIHENENTCTFEVVVSDNENPEITCPVNMVVTGDPNECNAVVNYTATATDNCPGSTISYSPANGSTLNAGVTTVTATATDVSGNHDVCTFNVFVSFPFTFDYNIETLEECSEVTITWHGGCPDWNVNIVLGNLDLYVVQEYVAVNVPNSGSITWTLPPDVPAGNYLFYIEEVSRTTNYLYGPAFIINNTPPNVITQDITVSLDATGNATITADQIDNGSNDICGIDHMTITPNTFNCGNVGENTVTLSVTDLNGNTVSQTAIVTVIDDQELIIHDCSENIMVSNDAGLCSAIVNWTAPTLSDNCEIQSFTSDHQSGDVFPVGSTDVTYIAIDFSGNEATCSFNITINDIENPTVTCVLDQLRNTQGLSSTYTAIGNEFDLVLSNDNCGIISTTYELTGATIGNGYNSLAGIVFNAGITNVEWIVYDQAGNIANCNFTVTVNGGVITSITCPLNQVRGTTAPTCAYQVVGSEFDPISVSGAYSLTYVLTGATSGSGANTLAGIIFNKGLTHVEWSVTDISGNTSSCNFAVTVYDNDNPEAICKNITIILNAFGLATIAASDINDGSHDPCGLFSMNISQTEFNCSNLGDNTVTLTVTDQGENVSTCNATVTIVEGHFVQFTNCPDNIVVACQTGNNGVKVSWDPPGGMTFGSCTAACTGGGFISGYSYIGKHNGHHYYVSNNDKLSWTAANTLANSAGGYLAVINTAAENTFIKNGLNCDYAWIGFTDQLSEGNFIWVNGNPVTYTNWESGEPNNQSSDFCGSSGADWTCIKASDGKWRDRGDCNTYKFILEIPCDPALTITQIEGPASGSVFNAGITTITYLATDNFGSTATCTFTVSVENQFKMICPENKVVGCVSGTGGAVINWEEPEVMLNTCNPNVCAQNVNISGFKYLGEYNGHRYYKSNSSDSWLDARNISIANGGYLVSINSNSENNWLRNEIMESNEVWIGFTDELIEGTFVWSNGDPNTYTNWDSGEPNNSGSGNCSNNQGDYVSMKVSNGKWKDFKTCESRKFIMEIPCAVGYTIQQTAGPLSGSIFPSGTSTITYSATSIDGETISCSFNIKVESQFEISCPPDISVTCDEDDHGHQGDFGNLEHGFSGGEHEDDEDDDDDGDCDDDWNEVKWDEPKVIFNSCDPNACPSNKSISGFDYLGTYNGHRYYKSNASFTWHNAKTNAIANNGHLLVVNNAAENTFIKDEVDGNNDYWIGFNDEVNEGTFDWVNGELNVYTNWDSGEPNNSGSGSCSNSQGDYVSMNASNGKWKDRRTCETQKYILEIPCIGYTLQQIAGPPSGSKFPLGITTIIYQATTSNGETATCSFTVNVTAPDSDCDGVADCDDVCPGGDDTVDNNHDGKPDCRYLPAYADIIPAWKCGTNKVYVCHLPPGNPGNAQTLCISYNAVQSHLSNHDDYIGECGNANCNDIQGRQNDLKGYHTDLLPSGEKALVVDHFTSKNDDIEVYPNPTQNLLYVKLPYSSEAPIQMQLFNSMGEEIMSQRMDFDKEGETVIPINTMPYASGLYFVKATFAGTKYVKAFSILK